MWSKISIVLALSAPAMALWPQPVEMTTGSSTLWLNDGIAATYNGKSVSLPAVFRFSAQPSPAILCLHLAAS